MAHSWWSVLNKWLHKANNENTEDVEHTADSSVHDGAEAWINMKTKKKRKANRSRKEIQAGTGRGSRKVEINSEQKHRNIPSLVTGQ